MLNKIFLLSALVGLSACATPKSNYQPEITQFSRPPLGTETTVSVGDEMLSQGNRSLRDGVELNAESRVSGYTLTPGFYPKKGDDVSYTYYGFSYGTVGQSGYGALTRSMWVDEPASVAVSADGNKFCVVTVFSVVTCNERVSFTKTRKPISNDNTFQQTLIYSGRIGDKINVGYREFSGSFARPAFNNDVEYDLSTSNIIAYKGASLHVLNADNTKITYVVLTNFNTPQ